MNIYDVSIIENELERIAEANDGEIPSELLQKLVEAQTSSLEQVGKLVKYIKYAESFIDTCKSEEKRIADRRRIVENRIASIKNYLVPFVEKNKKVEAGTFTLSTRKSASVELDDNFNNPEYSEQVISYKPDRKKIKGALQDDIKIEGARLISKLNLQIK